VDVDMDVDALAAADAGLSLEILPREVDVRLIAGMDTIDHFRVPNPKKLIQLQRNFSNQVFGVLGVFCSIRAKLAECQVVWTKDVQL
jgi:hypothetical protein